MQAVRLQLFRENIGGALDLLEAAHATHPDPRYAEQAAKIRGWLQHLGSREAYLAAQEAQYRQLRWRAGLKLLEKRIRILLGRKTRKMVERRTHNPSSSSSSVRSPPSRRGACWMPAAARAAWPWRWPR